ncbi:MAG: type II 3-dehydroquinate dehydratase [Deltaproteobacteria bacterium]|nr:type II 3-dehydroquinate dehydratase [Deltaproteobacteria bacterium]
MARAPGKARRRLAVIHGPNLNLLGEREPEVYGRTTLAEINARLETLAPELGMELTCFQSNHEGALVEHIQKLRGQCEGILINAAGLTHSSVSLRDALIAVGIPLVEVHLSNTYAREPMRRTSLLSDVAMGVVVGFGPLSYELALRALAAR